MSVKMECCKENYNTLNKKRAMVFSMALFCEIQNVSDN